MLNVGDTLGGIYEITEKIGSGGGGIIFKANHLRMKKPVAIKLIKDNVKNILENRAEVDLLKNLKNDYLPQVLDFVEDNNDVYTVMEFIEGENFKQLISAGKTYDKKSVQKYAVQLCEAVEYLHSQNPPIIHSDIKPANIMLTPDDRICLIDFNISSVSDGAGAYSVGGSAGYAAPEQFKKIIEVPVEVDEFREETRFIDEEDDPTEIFDEDATEILDADDNSDVSVNSNTSPSSVIVKNETQKVGKAYIDTRTDIYGIGASLHYIITGRRPVDGKTDFKGIKVSKKMQRIISKAMAPDPNHRYKSVSEMKKDIENNGTLKINLKAAIAASVAVVLIAAAAIIYPIVHIDMKTKAVVHSYGCEFVIEKNKKKEILGGKVTNKYNATAVSLMEQLYNYYGSLPLDEYLYTIKAGNEVYELVNEQLPDMKEDYGKSDLFYSSKLSPDTGDICNYLYNNFTNYTDQDDLYILFTMDEGKIAVLYVSDDPNLYNEITSGEGGFIHGNIGVAVTTDVYDVPLSSGEKSIVQYSINNLVSMDISFSDIKYSPDDDTVELYGDLSGEDMSDFTKFKYLKEIDLASTTGVNISDFPEIPSVEKITFSGSDITSIEGITEKFPNLKTLNISNTGVTDLSPISGLSSLEYLYCNNCNISDLSVIKNNTHLKSLSLSNSNYILSLSAISGMESIEVLDIQSITFENDSFIDVISTLKNLKSLNLSSVKYKDDSFNTVYQIPDINGFENLTKLEELHINVADITPLAGLTEMKILDLDHVPDKIKDFSPIKNMTKLEVLTLSSADELDAAIFENLTNIKKLSISMSSQSIGSESKHAYIDTTELLKYISNMKSLEELTLRYIKFSASDIDTICSLTSLSKLALTTDISGADSQKITNSLAEHCHVYISPDEFEVWGKGEAVATETKTEDDLEYPVFDDDLEEPDSMPVYEDDYYDESILLIYSDLKGTVELSEKSGDEKADALAEMLSFKMYFPSNVPFTDGLYSEYIKPIDGVDNFVVYTLYYDKPDGIDYGMAYLYALVEAGYHIKLDETEAGWWHVYDDSGNQVIMVINYTDGIDVQFGGPIADSSLLF